MSATRWFRTSIVTIAAALAAGVVAFAGVDVHVENNPTFDFTLYYNGQWLVMTVMSVTSL